jgi:hypothetical protein
MFGLKDGGFAIRNGLNLNGQVAFRVSLRTSSNGFEDFIVRADPVPEPSTWVLALLGLATFGTGHRLGRRSLPKRKQPPG